MDYGLILFVSPNQIRNSVRALTFSTVVTGSDGNGGDGGDERWS